MYIEAPRAQSSTRRRAQRALGFIFKISERCNLACTYCYFFFGGDESYRTHPPFVLPETIEGLIAFARDAIAKHEIDVVRIGFHGGEPLLLKKAQFRSMCERLTTELGPHCKLELNVQTNGVLIDPEWVDIFADYGIDVGVSFDGPPEIHNATRITKKGRGTYAESLRGWDLLMDASAAGRIPEPGVLCVVDPLQSGADTFRHFTETMRVRHLDFLLPDETHDSTVVDEEFVRRCGDYLIEICHAWFSLGTSDVHVRFIDYVVGPLLDDELCRRSVLKGDPRSLFTISSNGEIAPDDAMRPLAPRFRETGMVVGRDSLTDVLAHDVWRELSESQQLPTACRPCTWRNICNGGTRQHRFSAENGFDNPSIYCATLKRLYAYVASQLVRGGYPVEELERRLSFTPA